MRRPVDNSIASREHWNVGELFEMQKKSPSGGRLKDTLQIMPD
jgi:hypothetical protein